MQKPLRINNQIRLPEVQVLDENGKQLGVMSTTEALKLAQNKGLDLVEVGPNVQPSITKIMDYGKYMYRKERQEKKTVKHKEQKLKTVRVGFKTGQHDMDFKARQIEGFLKEGNLVKVELTLRGREKALSEMGRTKLINFLSTIKEEFVTQDNIKKSPFGWMVLIKK